MGLASRFGLGTQQIHCQNTPRPHRSVTNGTPCVVSRWCLRIRVMRSCGSRLPTRMPFSKSMHAASNASPVGSPGATLPAFASGSQSLAVARGFIGPSSACRIASTVPYSGMVCQTSPDP